MTGRASMPLKSPGSQEGSGDQGRRVLVQILCNENCFFVLPELFSWGTHPSLPSKSHKTNSEVKGEKKENSKNKQNPTKI